MPELQWDEFDFMHCLEVEPEIDEYSGDWVYKIAKDDLELTVHVPALQNYIYLALYHQGDEQPIVEFSLLAHGEIRHINDERGEYLEFNNCSIVPPLLAVNSEIEDLVKNESQDWSVELSIKPRIQIRYRD